ncbi:MAG: phosphopantothenoylcysteine decarboxylase [Candidatus Omnitrophica bacterium]|nr:phosphopantothenoylcysteine decarboxylase [Candidatus Omnitrophota bacterium]
MRNFKVLVTCGPTWVKIDDVRVLSNHSSGEMGHRIAEEFLAKGAQVTIIEGAVTDLWSSSLVKVIKYRFFDELEKSLNLELKKNYDYVIHAAAVSDFQLARPHAGKMDSSKPLTLKLVPAPKLIDTIKKQAPQTVLVGFKLEPDLKVSTIEKETRGLFEKSKCDWVDANSLKGGYKGFIVDRNQQILAKVDSKKKIAKALVKLLMI